MEHGKSANNTHASSHNAFQNNVGDNKVSKEANLDTVGTIKLNKNRLHDTMSCGERQNINTLSVGARTQLQCKDKRNPSPWHRIKHLNKKRRQRGEEDTNPAAWLCVTKQQLLKKEQQLTF